MKTSSFYILSMVGAVATLGGIMVFTEPAIETAFFAGATLMAGLVFFVGYLYEERKEIMALKKQKNINTIDTNK